MAKIRPIVRGFGPVAPGGGAVIGAGLQAVGQAVGEFADLRTNRELLDIREQAQVDALEFKQFEKMERSEAMSQIIIKQIERNEETARIIAEAIKARKFENVQGDVDTFENDHDQALFEGKSKEFQDIFLSLDQPRRLGNINKTGTAVEAGRLRIIVDNFLTSSKDIIKTAADSSPFSIIEDFQDLAQLSRSLGIREQLIESIIGKDRRAAMDSHIAFLPILKRLAALNDEHVIAAYTSKERQTRRADQLRDIETIQSNEVVLDAANETLTGISLIDKFAAKGSIASIQEAVENAGLTETQRKRMQDRVTAMALARKSGKRKVDPEVIKANQELITGEVKFLVDLFLSDSVDEEIAEDSESRSALLLQHANDAMDLYSQAAIMAENGEFGIDDLVKLKFMLNEIMGPLFIVTKVAEKGFLSELVDELVFAAKLSLSPVLAFSLIRERALSGERISDPGVPNAIISKEIRLMNIGEGRFQGFTSEDRATLEASMINDSINTPGLEQPMPREQAFAEADKIMSSALTRLFREVKGMDDEAIAEALKAMAESGAPTTEARTTVPLSTIAGNIQANLDNGMTLNQIEQAASRRAGFNRGVFNSAVEFLGITQPPDIDLTVEDRRSDQVLTGGLRTSTAGVEFIKKAEGFSPIAERILGEDKFTLGFGNTNNVKEGDITTRDEASVVIEGNISSAEDDVRALVPNVEKLNQNEFDALVSLLFNVGRTNVHARTRAIIAINEALSGGVRDEEAMKRFLFEAFDKEEGFVKQDGKIIKGLVNRRAAERRLFLKGK